MSQCRSYLFSQSRELHQNPVRPFRPGPAVTLSYQTGAGEHEIAARIAEMRHLNTTLKRAKADNEVTRLDQF
jgi:hypothetical protein